MRKTLLRLVTSVVVAGLALSGTTGEVRPLPAWAGSRTNPVFAASQTHQPTGSKHDPAVEARAKAQAQEPQPETTNPLSSKQKKDLLKNQFEGMKRDADELADLAKSLQEDLDKSNEHVMSLKIVDKAEKIEKLAKKIKTTARGF